MQFKFDINLTDKYYLDYNIFWNLRSPYGKKQILKMRLGLTALFCILSLLSLFGGGFSRDAFIGIIPYWIVFAAVQLVFTLFFKWTLGEYLKSLKKKGKMGYSPISTIEFFEEHFAETTPENKTEQKYTSIERISILRGNVIYIHVNNVMSYILPFSCFEDEAQKESFLAFLGTKCAVVDLY